MTVKTVKAYNLAKLIEENAPKHNDRTLTTFLQHEMVVLEGSKGVHMFCSEGVGETLESVEDVFELEVCYAPERDEKGNPKTISIVPLGTIGITPKEIFETCESRDVTVSDFIRRFGERLEQNFEIQLQCMGKIGFNVSEYYDGSREPLRGRR